MKKSLLLLLLAVMASAIGAKAVTDGQTYAEVNGIKIVNQWIFDRVHSGTDYTSNAICNQRARTATMDQGIIYVARSEELAVIIGSDTISQSVIHRFSAVDGSPLEDLPLTLDGAPYGRFLGVASIGLMIRPFTGAMPESPLMLLPRKRLKSTVSAMSSALWATAVLSVPAFSKASYLATRPASSILILFKDAIRGTSFCTHLKGRLYFLHIPSTKSLSRTASSPLIPCITWITSREMPSSSMRLKSTKRRHTESAPPDTPTVTLSPFFSILFSDMKFLISDSNSPLLIWP
jgi:hypothetical protein